MSCTSKEAHVLSRHIYDLKAVHATIDAYRDVCTVAVVFNETEIAISVVTNLPTGEAEFLNYALAASIAARWTSRSDESHRCRETSSL